MGKTERKREIYNKDDVMKRKNWREQTKAKENRNGGVLLDVLLEPNNEFVASRFCSSLNMHRGAAEGKTGLKRYVVPRQDDYVAAYYDLYLCLLLSHEISDFKILKYLCLSQKPVSLRL